MNIQSYVCDVNVLKDLIHPISDTVGLGKGELCTLVTPKLDLLPVRIRCYGLKLAFNNNSALVSHSPSLELKVSVSLQYYNNSIKSTPVDLIVKIIEFSEL